MSSQPEPQLQSIAVIIVNKKIEIFNTGAGETADGGTSTLIVKVMYMKHATGL